MTDLSPLAVPMWQRKQRVAVLVDGDNFPHSDLARLEALAAGYGEVVIRRVFGDAKRVGGWPEAMAYQMLHCDSGVGKKNLADMHLTVAAMDLAQRGLASAFAIASDDRDFEPLTQYLIETGRTVVRVRKPVENSKPSDTSNSKVIPAMARSPLEILVCEAIKANGAASGLLIADLNARIRQSVQTKISDTAEGNWRAYLTARPNLFVCDGRGPGARVRLKP
ncbi:NYN domain-containing protein [Cypionkella sinensis]|uniref:NYN domain-containing protein n=1 Tax=Cypionkella sinensis TaxID=1756043 RepID=A0ABV7J7P5_9RHOB